MANTQNLDLPLFAAGDAVDLLGVYNVAMQRLDAAFVDVATNARIAQIEATANDAATAAAAAQAAAATAQTVASQAAAAAATAQTTATAAADALDTTGADPLTTSDLAVAIITDAGVVRIPQLTNE